MRCTSCNVHIHAKDNFVKFRCPNCGEVEIVRCEHCREKSNKYTCPNCKFVGP